MDEYTPTWQDIAAALAVFVFCVGIGALFSHAVFVAF